MKTRDTWLQALALVISQIQSRTSDLLFSLRKPPDPVLPLKYESCQTCRRKFKFMWRVSIKCSICLKNRCHECFHFRRSNFDHKEACSEMMITLQDKEGSQFCDGEVVETNGYFPAEGKHKNPVSASICGLCI